MVLFIEKKNTLILSMYILKANKLEIKYPHIFPKDPA